MAFGNLRRSGIAQLILGLLSIGIGIALVVIFTVYFAKSQSGSTTAGSVVAHAVAAAFYASPLYCGVFYIIAGSIGCSARASNESSMTCIKVCVVVFSIFAILAAIVQTILCAWYSYGTSNYANGGQPYQIAFFALTVAGAGVGFIELLTAIIASGIVCCCPGSSSRPERYEMK